ncbi:MAG: CopG family transcriptional regulator [Ignavibacteria bacterium GWA2_35_9]|nr:MAG: CopG family transcriptional regulator [Bdellovibrionales bacterium RIFOXYB2_FULL_36_6]OGU28601.1 MAG: CopG family transcriptional regulator [Ignavibacteria bacterium GWA2_35_9]OGU43241.1 MAG: CopG family transcriptional regulator [Ignavibacteria bacterium GWB2_36_8]OGU49853.1 MAG: CopG family transcriptional regulator [Ignavibacteria bacterium GWC2_36_12]
MSKTITLRLSEESYKVYRKLADRDNRPISNFIETAVKRFIEHNVYVDEFEMEEIRNNKELNKSLKRGFSDMKSKKGRLVA